MGSGYAPESHVVPLPDSPYAVSESGSVRVSVNVITRLLTRVFTAS